MVEKLDVGIELNNGFLEIGRARVAIPGFDEQVAGGVLRRTVAGAPDRPLRLARPGVHLERRLGSHPLSAADTNQP
ncbi:MAG: hypothetical protein ACJ780_10615 [Solirubrobacteraceae bacterium]